jgi:hypothetical protein
VRTIAIAFALSFFVFFHNSANAQGLEAAVGFSTVTAPSASSASGDHSPVTLSGGLYPSFNANFFLKKNFGVGGEIAWRGAQGLYLGYQPYRPLLWDFNAVWAPHISETTAAELMAGVGAESVRFYGFTNCGFSGCTNYISSNHFLGHFGAGLRYKFHGNFFVRPEAHVYLINNNQEFSSGVATRFGVSIGYSFSPY